MSKGSRQRKVQNKKQFEENWDKIFGRKKTPKHATTQIHKDKTKTIPRNEKYNDFDLEAIEWGTDETKRED